MILTLAMDEASAAIFEGRRRRFFPAARNLIPAHLTLFHRLPGAELARVAGDLAAASRAQPAFALAVTGLRSLGHGVAYRLSSPDLSRLRARLAARWSVFLSPQDRQPHRPHVTVQNKVDPDEARATLAELQADFAPFAVTGTGLDLWRYRGGPWEPVERFCFPPSPA